MLQVFSELIYQLSDDLINPSLQEHHAYLEILDISKSENEFIINCELLGPCSSCNSLEMTRRSIEALIREEVGTNVIFEWKDQHVD